MQIVNDTDQDARVRVAGGGSGIEKPDDIVGQEDTSKWPLLRSRCRLDPNPALPGPWTVHFVVNGCCITKEVLSEKSVVRLTPTGRTFAARVD